jgi:hypothetical protein
MAAAYLVALQPDNAAAYRPANGQFVVVHANSADDAKIAAVAHFENLNLPKSLYASAVATAIAATALADVDGDLVVHLKIDEAAILDGATLEVSVPFNDTNNTVDTVGAALAVALLAEIEAEGVMEDATGAVTYTAGTNVLLLVNSVLALGDAAIKAEVLYKGFALPNHAPTVDAVAAAATDRNVTLLDTGGAVTIPTTLASGDGLY